MIVNRNPKNPEEARESNERYFQVLQSQPELLAYEIISKYGYRQLSDGDKKELLLPLSARTTTLLDDEWRTWKLAGEYAKRKYPAADIRLK